MTDYLISDLDPPANPLDGTELAEILQAAVSAKIDLQSIANLAKVLGQAGVSQLIQSLGAGDGSFIGRPAVHVFIADGVATQAVFFGNAVAGPLFGYGILVTDDGSVFNQVGDGLGGFFSPYTMLPDGRIILGAGDGAATMFPDGRMKIGNDVTPPVASSIYDVVYGGAPLGARPVPLLTTAEREAIASPDPFLMVNDTDLDLTCVFIGGAWCYFPSVEIATGILNLTTLRLGRTGVVGALEFYSPIDGSLIAIFQVDNEGLGLTTTYKSGDNTKGFGLSSLNDDIASDPPGNRHDFFGAPWRVSNNQEGLGLIEEITQTGERLFAPGEDFDANPIDPSALAEWRSATKGILPPRMTTAEREAIVTPADFLIVGDTDRGTLCMCLAGSWSEFTMTPII